MAASGGDRVPGPVLVTGGRGRLARAIAAAGGHAVAALGRSELDIADGGAVRSLLQRLRPVAVINAAGASAVETAETHPEAAWRDNVLGPGALAAACADGGVPLIHISTDYVFGGETDRPWREDDPVSPVNAYGRMKAEGEARVLDSPARACVVRVAWLFGDRQDFIARLLASGGAAVTVAEDQIGSPTPIHPLAARLLMLAGRMGEAEAPRRLHLAGSPPVSRADWVACAFDALRAAGLRPPELIRAPMAALPSASPRPRFSALDCSRAEALFGSPILWRPAAEQPGTFTRTPSAR